MFLLTTNNDPSPTTSAPYAEDFSAQRDLAGSSLIVCSLILQKRYKLLKQTLLIPSWCNTRTLLSPALRKALLNWRPRQESDLLPGV
jgi:hypothetical protein